MKRAFGSVLCFIAIIRIYSLMIAPPPDTPAHRYQDWAVVGVILAIGVPLSMAKKKAVDSEKK